MRKVERENVLVKGNVTTGEKGPRVKIQNFIAFLSIGVPHKNARLGPWCKFVSVLFESGHKAKAPKGA